MVTNKDLLYSRWNYVQCYMPAWMLGVFGGEWIHVHVWLNPFAIHLKLTTMSINYTQIQNNFFIFSFFKLKHSWCTIFFKLQVYRIVIHNFKGYTSLTVIIKHWLYASCCTIYPSSLWIICSWLWSEMPF